MRALPWLQREFGTNRDALNCMRVCELSLKSENFSVLDGRELLARETNVLIARLARCLFAAHGPAVVRIVNKARTSGVE